ncbi:S8 family serine peptidase [Deinococcus hopiensis]|uniref:Subtilisin-like serine proteases n=1 Tax=Deinococcus hopiensis KR-140 TaxID=695939 RepID=A0A1W1UGF3_9DEIO|nr:S8 family serine peptidase [Deinococcus hopiensis]SMB80198.1 Subtilisin-like serine proteases [Deinococcus hopiensis KR-140]
MPARRRSTPAFGLLTLLLLSACSSTLPTTPDTASAPRYDSVASVPLKAGDTRESVARILGGTVIEWNDSGCAAGVAASCTALVGLDRGVQALSRLKPLGDRSVQIEPNRDAFSGSGVVGVWAGGVVGVWAGGIVGVWAGGVVGVWAGGVYANLPANTSLWQKVNLQQAQALASNLGAGVTVAVIDTGIDLQHPAFQASLTDSSTWRDFYGNDNVPQEEGILGNGAYGHGTSVAGIVLQVAPKARIMPIRALGSDGSGDAVMVAQAIQWAAARGANVINLSLGSAENSTVVQSAINTVTAQGILVVASAGNENQNVLTYPAANATQKGSGEYALSVGSVDLSDLKSTFSNYGRSLELVAPSENVYGPAPENRMVAWSGTSMAAPMAAGGLALALGQQRTVALKDLTAKMAGTAFDVYNGGANDAYKGMLGPKGRLDLSKFLDDSIQH